MAAKKSRKTPTKSTSKKRIRPLSEEELARASGGGNRVTRMADEQRSRTVVTTIPTITVRGSGRQ